MDIKPGSGEEAVTIHNLEEYIDRLVSHLYLTKAIEGWNGDKDKDKGF